MSDEKGKEETTIFDKIRNLIIDEINKGANADEISQALFSAAAVVLCEGGDEWKTAQAMFQVVYDRTKRFYDVQGFFGRNGPKSQNFESIIFERTEN